MRSHPFRNGSRRGEASMCKLCDEGMLNRLGSRRNFLKGAAAASVAAAGVSILFAARPPRRNSLNGPTTAPKTPADRAGVTSFAVVLRDVDGPECRRLRAEPTSWSRARPSFRSDLTFAAGAAEVIDARGRIVMPGFIDTHHHQFETALRSFLADGVLINDGSGSASGSVTYFEYILNKFAPRLPSAGRLHQRTVRGLGAEPAR